MHFVDSNPPTPLLENKRHQFDMNGVLHCIVDMNFAVYPFELCFELSYVNTSLMLPGSNTALEFSFFFFLFVFAYSTLYFSFGHS